jgi:hypothetical protein
LRKMPNLHSFAANGRPGGRGNACPVGGPLDR